MLENSCCLAPLYSQRLSLSYNHNYSHVYSLNWNQDYNCNYKYNSSITVAVSSCIFTKPTESLCSLNKIAIEVTISPIIVLIRVFMQHCVPSIVYRVFMQHCGLKLPPDSSVSIFFVSFAAPKRSMRFQRKSPPSLQVDESIMEE